MGKCSVESVEDCPASTHGRGRFAGVICAATCFILTCSIIIYTVQWERRSEIHQQMENLYELKNIVDRLNSQLKNCNTSLENVVVNVGEVSERLEELTQNVHSSHDSMIDVNDVTKEFKISLDELKEIFMKYRNDLNEMKRKQVEMKADLDKLENNNNGTSAQPNVDKDTKDVPSERIVSQNHTSFIVRRSIKEQTRHDLIILEDTNHNLRYVTVPSLQFKNIALKQILEDFDKKNYSSKMERCKVSKTELEQSILMYREKLDIFKMSSSFPSGVLRDSVEKILVSEAKDEEYRKMIDETKSLFTLIHCSLGAIKEKSEELEKKFEQMEECARSNFLVESNEQKPGDKLDFEKIVHDITRITEDVFNIKNNVRSFNNRIFALEFLMDNTVSFYDSFSHENDKVCLQETTTSAPEGNPVVVEGPVVRSDVSNSEVEGSGFQGQWPVVVHRESHESGERPDNMQEKTSTLRDSSRGRQKNDGLEDVLENALYRVDSNNNGSGAQPNVDKDVYSGRKVLQNHNSFIDSSSMSEQTLHDLIVLGDAYHNFRYAAIPTLNRKNNIMKGILEDFEKKNYSSKMENCQVNKSELRDTILKYNKNVIILKTGLTYPSNVLSPTVEKILVSNAENKEYEMRIDETKILFIVTHSILDELLENILEFEEKFRRMVDCIEKYRNITLRLEPNEQRPENVGEQLDVDQIMSEIDTITDNLLDIKNNIVKYDKRIFGLELEMDNVGNVRDLNNHANDEVPLQEITGVPDNSPVVTSDVSIMEVEGSGFQGQEPVNRKSHESKESSTTPVSSSGWQINDRLEDAQDKGNSLTDEEPRVDNQKSESAVEDKETTKEDKENNHMDEKNLQEHGSITNKFFEQTFFQQVTWTEAKEKCEDRGMRLVVIANAKERESILTWITQSGTPAMKQDSFWISEMDQRLKDSLPPSTARDDDSENNNDAELCPFMDVTSAGESPCSDKRSYICEKINIIEQPKIY